MTMLSSVPIRTLLLCLYLAQQLRSSPQWIKARHAGKPCFRSDCLRSGYRRSKVLWLVMLGKQCNGERHYDAEYSCISTGRFLCSGIMNVQPLHLGQFDFVNWKTIRATRKGTYQYAVNIFIYQQPLFSLHEKSSIIEDLSHLQTWKYFPENILLGSVSYWASHTGA